MARLLRVGISMFVIAAILEIFLATVALAGILSPTSWTWATLTIVTMLLLMTSLIIISISRQRR